MAEALRQIRQVDVDGIVIGIAMLDPIHTEVKRMKISGKKEIGDELLKRVKIYNYIPASAEMKPGCPDTGIPEFTGMRM